ncbi:MAG TPA: response regulator [Spirochaetota bacterium]
MAFSLKNKLLKRKRHSEKNFESTADQGSGKRPWQELDSFFDARIAIYIGNKSDAIHVFDAFVREGFSRTEMYPDIREFREAVHHTKFDLILIDIEIEKSEKNGYALIEKIRAHDADVQIVTISRKNGNLGKKIDLMVHRHLRSPLSIPAVLKTAKKALGDKANYEIGMQFFNALFGMQMCTHRDLHQRTFDHVIRTTKVYGKFLLFLNRRRHVELNSWVFKNFLMASLVHDIGKLLVMHGVLYKDGKLTDFEYEQVKRHPWNSITALLGGYDIDFFARGELPLKSVSGYNDKNLGAQVRQWIFKIFVDDFSALTDVETYFNELSTKPFIHSLNFDLLYIVFRHHDGVNTPYLSEGELELFGKILGRQVETKLSENSPLDVVTNALTLCDMYDALLDTSRDYRKASYCTFLALLILYNEMKRGTFFPFLVEEFIRYVIENEPVTTDQPFSGCTDAGKVLEAISAISSLFFVTRDQESDFNDFLIENRKDIEEIAVMGVTDELRVVHERWIDYYEIKYKAMVENFIGELKNARLLDKEIADFSINEIKTFDMLYRCYYSFSSSYKQRKLIEYLVNTVIITEVSDEVRVRIVSLLSDAPTLSRPEIEKLLIDKGYARKDLFAVFLKYDENMLINELNDYLRHHGV